MEMFKRRPGTDKTGAEYEDLITAYYSLLLAQSPNIDDFEISSNDPNLGNFDDVVIEFTQNNTKNRIALQLKHHKDKKHILPVSFLGKSGDYSLQKYFEERQKFTDFHLVIFTNAELSSTENELRLQDEDRFFLKITKCEPVFHFLNTNAGSVHRFQLHKFKNEDISEYESFFEKLHVYPSQKGIEEIKGVIKDLFLGQNSYKNFINFVNDWSKEVKKFKLTKETIIFKSIECLLSPFCVWKIHNFEPQLLEILSKFEFTIAREVCYDKNFVEEKAKSINWQIEKRFGLTPDDGSVLKLWHLKLLPLIINPENLPKEVLKLFFKLYEMRRFKRFFVFTKPPNIEFPKFRVFCNYLDLQENCFDFKISLHGKECLLKDFVGSDEDLGKIFSVNDIFTQLISAGENPQTIFPYINRLIPKILINKNAVNISNKSDLFVISCNGRKPIERKKSVIYFENFCSDGEFSKICSKNSGKNIHHLLLGDDLEWLATKGSVRGLKQFLLSSNAKVRDCNVLGYIKNDLNLLFADPGMGKSVILEYFKQNCPIDRWPIVVNLREYSALFKNKMNHQQLSCILDYLITKKNYDEISEKIAKTMSKKRRILILWDGIDETPFVDNVITAVKFLSQLGYKQWVAGRCHLRAPLEEKLEVFSLTLTPLGEEEQINYITRRLNVDEIEAKKIIGMMSNTDILGIPLQIFMLTEIYQELKSSPILTDIYEKFVDKKFEILELKASNSDDNELAAANKNLLKRYLIKDYQQLALISCFDPEILRKLGVGASYTNFLLEEIENGDNRGFITKIIDNTPIFAHTSYAEYFAASFLKQNFQYISQEVFFEINFDEKYETVRYMFDMLMSEGSVPHLGVIYKDLGMIENDFDRLDLGGRTPLHLACIYCDRCEIFEEIEEGGGLFRTTKYRITIDNLNTRMKNQNIFENLVKNFENFYQRDSLLKMDFFEICDTAKALLPLETLLKIHQDPRHIVSIKNLNFLKDNPCTFISHCVKNNYSELFKIVDRVPFIEISLNSGTYTLLHFLAEFGDSEEILKKILIDPNYLKLANRSNYEKSPLHFAAEFNHFGLVKTLAANTEVDIKSVGGFTPLHLAAEKGNKEVVEFLIKKGAGVNLATENGFTPLHFGVRSGNFRVVEMLVEGGSNVNASTENGFTPLHAAAWTGFEDIVNYLVEKGADVNVMNKNGFTLLHYAKWNGHEGVAKFLLGSKLES